MRRQAVKAWGLTLATKKPEWHSDTVTAVVVPPYIDSSKVVKLAWKKYNLSLGGGLNKVAGKVFRIGHLGSLNEVRNNVRNVVHLGSVVKIVHTALSSRATSAFPLLY